MKKKKFGLIIIISSLAVWFCLMSLTVPEVSWAGQSTERQSFDARLKSPSFTTTNIAINIERQFLSKATNVRDISLRDASVFRMSAQSAFPYGSYNSSNFFFPPYFSDSDRMGYGRAKKHDEAKLQAGWYLDWGAQLQPEHPAGAEYLRTIGFTVHNTNIVCGSFKGPATSINQVTATLTGTALANNVALNPGALWTIGNEPDSVFNGAPIQAEIYAELYHYFYTTIKALDPTAKIVIGAVVQPSPLRMAYLDRVLSHYQATYNTALPVDVWNIHFYILPELECQAGASVPPFFTGPGWQVDFTPVEMLDIVAMENGLRAFRQWMFDRGYGEKPLIITEFGSLIPTDEELGIPADEEGFGFDEPLVAQFLQDTTDLFLTATDSKTGLKTDNDRLLQMWAWFATNSELGGDLFGAGENEQNLTIIGNTFVDNALAKRMAYFDLHPIPPTTAVTTTTTSLKTSAYLQNRGNDIAPASAVHLALIEATSGNTATEVTLDLGVQQSRYTEPPTLIEHAWHIESGSFSLTSTIPYSIVITSLAADAQPANNQLVYTTNWWPVADIAVTDLSLTNPAITAFKEPTSQIVTATVKNIGAHAVPSTIFQFQLEGLSATPVLLGSVTPIPGLQPGESVQITTTLVITQVSSFTLTASLPNALEAVEITNNNYLSLAVKALQPSAYLPIIQK